MTLQMTLPMIQQLLPSSPVAQVASLKRISAREFAQVAMTVNNLILIIINGYRWLGYVDFSIPSQF